MATVAMIAPELPMHTSMALVLNSPRLYDEKRGGEIDSHMDVVRFNRAVTAGHEEHSGTRETMRFVNSHVSNCITRPAPADQDFVRTLRDSCVIVVCKKHRWRGCQRRATLHRSNTVHWLNSQTWMTKQAKLPYELERQATLGLLVTLLAVEVGIKPAVYGFDMQGDQNGHYFEKAYDSTGSKFHDYSQERAVYRQLLAKGLITMHTSGL